MMNSIFTLLAVLVLTVYLVYQFSKRKFNYWKKQNVVYIKPIPILGNYGGNILLKRFIGDVTKDICKEFPNEPFVGAFYGTEPTLIVQDPELIKLITTKDFYYFSSREVSKYTHKEVMTQNLFFTYGDRWKVIRQNFSPLFSSAKMKNMFHLIEKCSYVFEDLLDEKVKQSNKLEIKSLMASFTMDCIGSCVFGVETNVMKKEVIDNPFRKMGDMIFDISNLRSLSIIGRAIWPAIFYGLGLQTFPDELFHFFNKLTKEVFTSRGYQPSQRNDFIDLILNLKKQKIIIGDSISNLKTKTNEKVTLEVNDELLIAQCMSFFAAGFETSATTLTFTLYELAKNEEAQNKAFVEIDSYLQRIKGKFEYSCVNELPFTEACIDEALRLYPVLGVITREVVEDYQMPNGPMLEKGVRVHLPVYHIQRDSKYFPEPEQYCPERFLAVNKTNITPYTYFPFGEGPRICIGMRFAKMQMLAGLVTFLKKYQVSLATGMSTNVTIEPRGLTTQPIGGIYLELSSRKGWEQRLFNKGGSNGCA